MLPGISEGEKKTLSCVTATVSGDVILKMSAGLVCVSKCVCHLKTLTQTDTGGLAAVTAWISHVSSEIQIGDFLFVCHISVIL